MNEFLKSKKENKEYNLQFAITVEEENSFLEERDRFLTNSYFFKNDPSKKALYIIDHGKFKEDFFIIN